MYRFKYYYKDGTNEISDCYGKTPELMYNDFDGLMDWDEFNSLRYKNLSVHEILELAMKVYKGFLPDFYRIEIINDENNEIIDYINVKEGGYMYRFKYYFKDGNAKLSDNVYKDTKNFDNEIQTLTKNKNFKTTSNEKKDLHKFLELAITEYEKNFDDLSRIDIIDNNTNEILSYVDKSECLIDGKKGHLLYDPNSFEAIDAKIEDNYDNCIYKFKYYYNDGTSSLSGGYAVRPTALYNDFDGLLDQEEFDSLAEKNMTTKKILELAVRAYKGFLPDFYRIEIVNDKTNEIIDYINVKEGGYMYRFKYYFKDGNAKLSDNVYKDTKNFDSEIQTLTKNKNFKTTSNEKKDFHKFLELAITEYEKNFDDLYRIDIIDNNTNEILSYVDKSECLIDGKKGHLLYDPNSFEAIDAKIEDNYDNCIYRFKYYYNDGTTDFSDIRTEKPEELYNDFDGLMDWDDYYALDERKLSIHEILELAMKVYKGFLPDFYRIEIINDKSNKVVDYIDLKEIK